jgi:hypothetical protein
MKHRLVSVGTLVLAAMAVCADVREGASTDHLRIHVVGLASTVGAVQKRESTARTAADALEALERNI